MFSFFICFHSLSFSSIKGDYKYARIVYSALGTPHWIFIKCWFVTSAFLHPTLLPLGIRNQQATKLFEMIFFWPRRERCTFSIHFFLHSVCRWRPRRRAVSNGNPIFECRRIRSELSFRFPFSNAKDKTFFFGSGCAHRNGKRGTGVLLIWCAKNSSSQWVDGVGKSSSAKFIGNF